MLSDVGVQYRANLNRLANARTTYASTPKAKKPASPKKSTKRDVVPEPEAETDERWVGLSLATANRNGQKLHNALALVLLSFYSSCSSCSSFTSCSSCSSCSSYSTCSFCSFHVFRNLSYLLGYKHIN